MRTTEQLIADLKKERQELHSKLNSLELYLMDEEYQVLPDTERYNLDRQHKAMQEYSNVLLSRVKRAQAQKYQTRIVQEAAELPEENCANCDGCC